MERYRVTPSFSGSGLHLFSNSYSSLSLRTKPGRRADASELGIFSAERYFRDGLADENAFWCDLSTNPHDSSVSSADRSGRNTPTATSSEASWNSRSGLLPNRPPVAAAVKNKASTKSEQRDKKPSSGRRQLFGVSCPCAGEKSVSVDEGSTEPKSPIYTISPKLHSNSTLGDKKQSIETEELFPTMASKELAMEEIIRVKVKPGNWAEGDTFLAKTPILSPKVPPLATFPEGIGRRVENSRGFSFPILSPRTITTSDETPRNSLEVFHPVEEDTVVLAKPAFRRSFTYAAATALEEEAASDESSDLFELESFAASSYPVYRSRRNSADEFSATEAAPSECMYPPSEASVVWSVATAEGGFDGTSAANFSSAASGYYNDTFRFVQADHDHFSAAVQSNRRKGSGGDGGSSMGLLNSCRCEKAVSVGPSPVPVRPIQPEVELAGVARLGNAAVARCRPARVYLPVRT